MIPETQKKLREAEFFLRKLEGQADSIEAEPAEVAEFYFSAFLSAARSVTFVLKYEEPEKYESWVDPWLESLDEPAKTLFKRFVDARNNALKRQTPSVGGKVESIQFPPPGLPLGYVFSLEEEGYNFPNYRVMKIRLRPEDTEEEVVPLCRNYLSILSRLVTEFLTAHD